MYESIGQRKDDVVSVFSTKLNQVRKRWLEGKPEIYLGKQVQRLRYLHTYALSQVNHFSTFLICCVFLRVVSGGMGDDLLAQHSDIHSVHMLFNLIVLTSTPLILMG